MSSDRLIDAKGLNKIYTSPMHPFARFKQALFGIQPPDQGAFHVLRDVDLEVHRGETVGIIGRNGAGKTTLLGILGNVIEPTSGLVNRSGRIATLLEITTGFNLEFTGRENAALFCSIHGVPSKVAAIKMPHIAEFADIGRYFDLPIRTYSSGMLARLGFACAVHVDADLIIIDETLGVGDAEFRVRCYDKINKMQKSGQTFLLVSHNQNVIANFCTRGVVLEAGQKLFDGATFEATEVYKGIRAKSEAHRTRDAVVDERSTNVESPFSERLTMKGFSFERRHVPGVGACGIVRAKLIARRDVAHPVVTWGIRNHQGIVICVYDSSKFDQVIGPMRKSEQRPIELRFRDTLLAGEYFVSASTYELTGDVMSQTSLHQNVVQFEAAPQSKLIGIVDLGLELRTEREPSVDPTTLIEGASVMDPPDSSIRNSRRE